MGCRGVLPEDPVIKSLHAIVHLEADMLVKHLLATLFATGTRSAHKNQGVACGDHHDHEETSTQSL